MKKLIPFLFIPFLLSSCAKNEDSVKWPALRTVDEHAERAEALVEHNETDELKAEIKQLTEAVKALTAGSLPENIQNAKEGAESEGPGIAADYEEELLLEEAFERQLERTDHLGGLEDTTIGEDDEGQIESEPEETDS